MFQTTLTFQTQGRGLNNITAAINNAVATSKTATGLCQLFLQHTSASLIICENSDPDVQHDLETFMANLAIDGDKRYRHQMEGTDDMSSHIRTVLTETSLLIPIQKQQLALGTWQGIFLWEHRKTAHIRKLIVSVF